MNSLVKIVSASEALSVFDEKRDALYKVLKSGTKFSFSMPTLRLIRPKFDGESSTQYGKRMGAEYAVFKPIYEAWAAEEGNKMREEYGTKYIKYGFTADGRKCATIRIEEPKAVDRVKAIDAKIAKLQALRDAEVSKSKTLTIAA